MLACEVCWQWDSWFSPKALTVLHTIVTRQFSFAQICQMASPPSSVLVGWEIICISAFWRSHAVMCLKLYGTLKTGQAVEPFSSFHRECTAFYVLYPRVIRSIWSITHLNWHFINSLPDPDQYLCVDTTCFLLKNPKLGAGEMAQLVELFAVQAWGPMFGSPVST